MRWIAVAAFALFAAGLAARWSESVGSHDAKVVSAVAHAEEGDAGGDAGGGAARSARFTWWTGIINTGWVGLLILLCSIAGLAWSIQYAVEQKRDRLLPQHLVTELEQFFEEQAFDEAAELCEAEDCYLTRVVGAGLAQMEGGYDSMRESVNAVNDEESTKVMLRWSNLSLIAGISPMLGLFGTVVGMISAFNMIANSEGAASASDLAGGITMALVTTFLGLLVAIPILCSYHFLKARALNVTSEITNTVMGLFQQFKAQKA